MSNPYVYLETLWKQILGLGRLTSGAMAAAAAAAPDASKEQKFVDAINAWRDALNLENDPTQDGLAKFISEFKTVTLTEGEQRRIADKAAGVGARLAELEQLRMKAKEAIARVEHFALYDATLATHNAVGEKFAVFSALAGQIASGFDKRITFGAAGRVVAVTITAKDKVTGQEQSQSIGVEFFVHSTLPVTFHAGYTVRAMEEVNFEEVASSLATAGGAELFSKVQDSTVNGTFTAFMSYKLCDMNKVRRCTHLTIGTDFKAVGERLYGGVSWPFGRAFVTIGVVSGETKEGEGPVNDVLSAAGQAVGARELFTAISTKRSWGGFVGVSFAPF